MFLSLFLLGFGSSELTVIENLDKSKGLIFLDLIEERILWGRSQAMHLASKQVEKRLQKKARDIGGNFMHISYIKSSSSHAEGRAWVFAEELNIENVQYLAQKHLERLEFDFLQVASFYRDQNQIIISVLVKTEEGDKPMKMTIDSQSSKLHHYTLNPASF